MSPYLDEMLELHGYAREAWLDALNERAPAIATQVRGYLIELAQIEKKNFLCDDSAALLAGATLLGQRMGAYTLDRLIGHGGMGTVWLAHRSDGRFEGRAAVKLLNAAFLGHPSEQRFTREGSVLAQLQHPNIAHLIDAGVAASGQPYLVLEYVEGERIDRYCEVRHLSVAARIALFLDVLAAVAHAHSHLIVHRDLKPSNILVTANGVVKLLDFGVAALLAPAADGQTSTPLTRDVAPGLTLEYAAPEQLLGKPVTTATDVYALGLVLFVLLAGRHPASPDNKTAADLMRVALDTEAPLASLTATDATVRRWLRGDLDNIVALALRKNSAERYSTADLFAQDLRRYLALEPVSARPTSIGYRAGKFVRRHRGAIVAVTAVAMALIGAVITTTLQMLDARRQREAVLVAVRRTEATKQFLQRVLSEFQERDQPLTSNALLERSSMLLITQYDDQPQFVAEMLIELAREYGDLLELKAALAMLAQARDIAQRQGHPLLLAKAECATAHMLSASGRDEAIASHLANAVKALERVHSPGIEIQVDCMGVEAALLRSKGDRNAAIELQQRARSMLEKAGITHAHIYNVVLSGIATDLMDDGRVAQALPLYRLSVEMHGRNGRGGTRMQAIAQQNVVTALYRLGEVHEAATLGRQQLDRQSQLQGPEEVSVRLIVNMSIASNRLARRDTVLDLLPAAAARAERAGDLNNFRLAYIELARARLRNGASRAEVEEPLLYMEATHAGGAIPPGTRVLTEIVRTELALAEGASTVADRRAQALLDEIGYPAADKVRSTYLALALAGRTALAVGDAERAATRARSALQIVEPMARGPDTSADVGEALLLLGQAQLALRQVHEARAQLSRAARCLNSGYGEDHPKSREARALIAGMN